MAKYSFPVNERNRKIGKVVGKAKTFHLKHQNTVMLLLSFVFTYYLIKTGLVNVGVGFLGNFGYISAFILGFLFSFGFTVTPASATLFFLAKHLNPLAMALVAAIGAGISNLLIYIYVKNNLLDEVRYILSEEFKLEFSKFEIKITQQVFKKKWLRFFVPAFAGLLTAAPIPTELMTAILWGVVKYNSKIVFIYSFIFSFIGILVLGLFGAGL